MQVLNIPVHDDISFTNVQLNLHFLPVSFLKKQRFQSLSPSVYPVLGYFRLFSVVVGEPSVAASGFKHP
jgi:hypothetical protein